jgi:hypothetical protein
MLVPLSTWQFFGNRHYCYCYIHLFGISADAIWGKFVPEQNVKEEKIIIQYKMEVKGKSWR